ncbi:hypothetical protein SS1G_13971 [Sclerotinia sclerotiorum 1980 UF-70]|uniref:Dol-P-Glc:Glc(2)Man(9)GlcNAc(2)-PP-Dol alpha-1,2-glucosyltransferase n=1 Tax=Sclerotinia sclerotiorum (strain ATCC 18683 / 1980 / Ss-1) TaxID=665079 RepID=A7F8P0_SCLS1|nr:hypothetical protein SS1G_13971 [Sclerotinia sclerotiorum 1980 UF-70]EDN99111.1 hypothetical protein SS1G_13971 [Sclerotinia sclerotiorum 1980 UF-70]
MSLWDYIPLPPYIDGVPSFQLDLEEIVYLQQKHIILGDCVEGTWKINAAALSMSFEKKIVEASLGRTNAESTKFFETIVPIDASTLPPLEIPESASSIGALTHIGWTAVAAEQIFDGWKCASKPRKNCDDRDPSLIDYAISQVYASRDSSDPGMLEKLDPRKEMVTLGLCTRFQDLILDQDNNNPSGYINTKDLHIWIIDKLGKEYRMLVIYLRYLKNYAATGVQAKRRIMDETLPEESFRFPSTEKELPENNFFEEAYESRKAVKASIEAADHLRHTTSVRVKRNEIKPYNYIPSDLENSIEKALLKGDPNHVQGNDFAEEGKRTNGDEYIHIPGLRPFPYIKKSCPTSTEKKYFKLSSFSDSNQATPSYSYLNHDPKTFTVFKRVNQSQISQTKHQGVLMAGAISTFLVGVLTAIGTNLGSNEGLNRRTAIAVPLSVACLASFWEYQVTKIVPEPYLDEVFHIPQAQAYCRWDYGIWDPKLTTPPGLYWWSHFLSIVSGYTICDVHFLRITNVIALTFIMMLAWECRNLIIRAGVANRVDQAPKLRSVDSLHTAVNIALFPPLFFFSGLYYTDVLSTCIVLYLYKQFLEQAEMKKLEKPRRNGVWFYLCGILALCMRQTNIFWVAIYLGGMEAIRTMKETYRLSAPSFKDPQAPSQEELKKFCDLAKSEHPHDPPIHAAALEGNCLLFSFRG